MRLGGWQRLWVVLSVCWLLSSGAVLFGLWQQPGTPIYLHPATGESLPLGITLVEDQPNGSLVLHTDKNVTLEVPNKADLREAVESARRQGLIDASEAKNRDAVMKALGLFGAIWLLPPFILYALGWSVGWVVKGFTSKAR